MALAGIRWASFAILMGLALSIPAYRKLMAAVWPSRADALKVVGYGFFFFGPAHAIYYFALPQTSSFEGTILGTTAPIWATALAFLFLHEAPGRMRIIGIAVASVGAYIVSVGYRLPAMDAGHSTGNVIYLSAVILESIAGILSIKIARRSSGITALWATSIGAAIFLGLAPLVFPRAFPFAIPSLVEPNWGWACLAYLVIVAGFVNFAIWYRLAERIAISLLALSLLIQPPIAIAIGMALRNEKMTVEAIVGTVLILAGLVVGTFRTKNLAAEVTEA